MTGAIAMVNSNYTNSRNKQLQVAGFKPTFESQERRWGIFPIANMPIITHKGGVYLNTSILKAGETVYMLDGETVIAKEWLFMFNPTTSVGTGIAKEEIAKQLAPMSESEKAIMAETIAINTGMLNEAVSNPNSIAVDSTIIDNVSKATKPVFPRDFKAESITALRVGGNEFTDINSLTA